jgi:HD-GYP domain-containing protein (c-di-GMP phosphodiesterase class II)
VEEVVSKVVESIFQNKYIIAGLGMLQTNKNHLLEHAVNSLTLMVAFANSLGYHPEMQIELGVGALLHDIGMLKTPSKIMNNKGTLSTNEIAEMRKHVQYGCDILKDTPGIYDSSLLMASQHHERINGSGFPLQLKGRKISTFGQMAGIIDVYDGATSDKEYKKSIVPSKALSDILMKRNSAFDVELVSKFVEAIGIYPFGSVLNLENGLIGIAVNINEKDLLHPIMRIIYNPQKKGTVIPYDVYPEKYKKDKGFKIKGVKPIEQLFLKKSDISYLLGIQH